MSVVPFHFFDPDVEWPVPPTEVLRPERRRDAHVFDWGAPLRPSVVEARAAMQAHIDEGLAYGRAHRRAPAPKYWLDIVMVLLIVGFIVLVSCR